ncbi:MAG: hypothetical protein D6706_02870, partial [Chloroflexi bacterium]
SSGLYTITYTLGQCSVNQTIRVNEKPVVSVTGTDVSCFGANDGKATANATGGTPPYSYFWNSTPPQSTQTATGLPAGTYSVTVTDANGCTATGSVTISEPPELQIQVTDSTDASCNGVNDGSITVVASNGPPPFQYSLNGSPFQPSGVFNNLSAGTYTALVQDANGCQATTTVTLDNISSITVNVDTVIHVSCYGASDGSFTLSASGGTGPYRYSLNGILFQQSSTFSNLAANTYTVVVKDAAGCEAITQVTINQAPRLDIITDTLIHNPCNGDALGEIQLTVSGGNPPYSYLWSTSQTTEDLTGLPAGVYALTVTDATNCTATASYIIREPARLILTAATAPVACNGIGLGAVNVTVSGGTTPYSYLWSTNDTVEDLDSLHNGIYTLT